MRKARNATIKLPKVANNVRIPMKIEIISNAVIVTHLPSYVFLVDTRYHTYHLGEHQPVMGTFNYCDYVNHVYNHSINLLSYPEISIVSTLFSL